MEIISSERDTPTCTAYMAKNEWGKIGYNTNVSPIRKGTAKISETVGMQLVWPGHHETVFLSVQFSQSTIHSLCADWHILPFFFLISFQNKKDIVQSAVQWLYHYFKMWWAYFELSVCELFIYLPVRECIARVLNCWQNRLCFCNITEGDTLWSTAASCSLTGWPRSAEENSELRSSPCRL